MRKTVTQPPCRSLGDDVNQAVSKHNVLPNAGVKVRAEEPNKKGALGEYSREDRNLHGSYLFPFFPLSQVHRRKIYWENASCTQEFPLQCLHLKSTFLPHVYFLNVTVQFSLGKLMRTFCAFFLLPPFPGKERSKNPTAFEFTLVLQIWVESLLMIQELQKIETRISYLFVCWTQGLFCFKPKLGP